MSGCGWRGFGGTGRAFLNNTWNSGNEGTSDGNRMRPPPPPFTNYPPPPPFTSCSPPHTPPPPQFPTFEQIFPQELRDELGETGRVAGQMADVLKNIWGAWSGVSASSNSNQRQSNGETQSSANDSNNAKKTSNAKEESKSRAENLSIL